MPTGRQINQRVRECGVVTLVSLNGEKLSFYPRGRLPAHVVAYLNFHEGRNARLLRDFCINVGRGIVTE